MNANIYYKGIKIINWIKLKKKIFAVMENDIKIERKLLIKPDFTMECNDCKKHHSINFYNGCCDKKYICFSCKNKGGKNPFYGKKHKIETIKKISMSKIGKPSPNKGKPMSEHGLKNIREAAAKNKLLGVNSGKNNPFYGKSHSPELTKQIVENGKITKLNIVHFNL